jgi:DNA mismatch endonuclease, patch repair protein
MPDVHNQKTRSYNMSQIRCKDTQPELLVRKFLFARGFRYRLHVKSLPGKPDLVFPKYKTVLFIHGCFWHGHGRCKYFVVPQTRRKWWTDKINRNKELDHQNASKLKKHDWKVLTIYECKLKPGQREKSLSNLAAKLAK